MVSAEVPERGKQLHRRPAPEADSKPDSLGEIERRSWRYLSGRTLREFTRDACPDLAAGLTYYAVLAVVPGLLAVVSLLGLIGRGSQAYGTILDIAGRVVPASALEVIRPVLEHLTESPRVGLALAVGVVGALWFVSAYLAAFGRALNRIYAVAEGRPRWKLQPLLMVLTLVVGILACCALLLVAVSGSMAHAIGDVFGVNAALVMVWRIAKWPLLAVVLTVAVALLYALTPNVRQPRFHWLSPGAVLAILTGLAGSALFGLYVASVSTYNAAYGSLAGVVIFLIWLWVTNIALLLGAELNAEVERARELQGGMAAERAVQLPPRDTRVSDKAAARHQADLAAGHRLRDDADTQGLRDDADT